MGQFSFMYADTDNQEALLVGREAYVVCPDGSYIHEPCYDGYGHFGGKDIYDLVADWNRQFLAVRPEYTIPQHGLIPTENGYKEPEPMSIDQYGWYRHYADLTLTPEEVANSPDCGEYRIIGIDLACFDDCNAKLPYPIKICKNQPGAYEEYPPSKDDPNQGWKEPEEEDD